MRNVSDMIKQTVGKMNEDQQQEVEREVQSLVHDIFSSKRAIKEHEEIIKQNKERLRKLQMPEELTLEIDNASNLES